MGPHDYALLAQEAYSAKPDIGKADSASRAIVRHTAAGLVIAFPGTDNLACVTTDLDVRTTNVPGVGDVHQGFMSAWKAIEADVVAVVGDSPVTLVGHSLGIAVALMASITMKLAGKPPSAVWGFEPPRVSPNLSVRSFLAGVPLHLYRNGNDLVTNLPLGWQQAGLLTHIGSPLLPFANVQDHAIARVISALQGR